MRRMNFRQRIAWLLVLFYLGLSCATMYYIFEISERYNTFALDHEEQYHKNSPLRPGQIPVDHAENETPASTSIFSFVWHVSDVPLGVWMLLLSLPYLQVFCMLLACTKPEPRVHIAYTWPAQLCLRCKMLLGITRKDDLKSYNSPLPNGHMLIDT